MSRKNDRLMDEQVWKSDDREVALQRPMTAGDARSRQAVSQSCEGVHARRPQTAFPAAQAWHHKQRYSVLSCTSCVLDLVILLLSIAYQAEEAAIFWHSASFVHLVMCHLHSDLQSPCNAYALVEVTFCFCSCQKLHIRAAITWSQYANHNNLLIGCSTVQLVARLTDQLIHQEID